MAITDFKINGYRSVNDVWLKLKPINVIVGPNGCGKSNMYRAMYLISCAATGDFARAIAEEGGIKSVLWAGGRDKKSIKLVPEMTLSVRVGQFEYNLKCGPAGGPRRPGPFVGDPEIKAEDIYYFHKGHRRELLKRRHASIVAKDVSGNKIDYSTQVPDNESILTGLRDPVRFPELFALRQELLDWRFYHHFRKDAGSPLRKPQIGVMTRVMRHDGTDLAAALATIQVCDGVSELLDESLRTAFPDSRLKIEQTASGKFKLLMQSPGYNRFFDASELSDGTIQYLCLLAALLSPQPPSVLALNEPETSIHPALYEPLAKLIIAASEHSQIWITTHATELSDYILELSGYEPLELEKVEGETRLVGVGLGGYKDPHEELDHIEVASDAEHRLDE